jgi:hypothetical protein
MVEMEFRDVAEEDSRPSTAVRAPSSGSLTCLSTTSGDAPGNAVITVICGNSSDGMSSCFRDPMEITPKTAMNTVIRAMSARLERENLAKRSMSLPSEGLNYRISAKHPGKPGSGT